MMNILLSKKHNPLDKKGCAWFNPGSNYFKKVYFFTRSGFAAMNFSHEETLEAPARGLES